jgi:hypothetical protein
VAVGIGGAILFTVPGVGQIAGAALLNASIGGVIQAFSKPDVTWEEFAMEFGINAVIGAATAGLGIAA